MGIAFIFSLIFVTIVLGKDLEDIDIDNPIHIDIFGAGSVGEIERVRIFSVV